MMKMTALLLALALGACALDTVTDPPVTDPPSTTPDDWVVFVIDPRLCNVNPDNCPGYPVLIELAETTDQAGRDEAQAWGVSYMPDNLSCHFFPGVSSCKLHVHLVPGLAVNIVCAQANNRNGEPTGSPSCDFSLVAE